MVFCFVLEHRGINHGPTSERIHERCVVQWFTKAGFTDVKIKRIGPKWYRGVRRHGLIMGCSVTGVKPKVCKMQVQVS